MVYPGLHQPFEFHHRHLPGPIERGQRLGIGGTQSAFRRSTFRTIGGPLDFGTKPARSVKHQSPRAL